MNPVAKLIQIDQPKSAGTWSVLELGFRPFFLGAAGHAVLSVFIWMGVYLFGWSLPLGGLMPMTWHAHEMIYGYTMAVIAGFLLTAIRNWTDRPTPSGTPLLLLFLLWAAGRIILLLGGAALLGLAAAVDALFILVLLVGAARPVAQAGQWEQLGILSILSLLLAGNLTFYLGALHLLPNGVSLGLYSGLYLILALIFKMARRVIPTFIERGAGVPVHLKNRRWIDYSSLGFFLLFAIADLVNPNGALVALLAGLLVVLHTIRLAGWHTPGIWRKPLLWVLYLAYGSLVVGFALKVAAVVFGLSPYLAVHAFTVGGIGMMTLGMMARVSLGHTGRNVLNPPEGVFWMCGALFIAAIVRVLFPLANPSHFALWIGLSQAFWIVAFGLFLSVYAPILVRQEVE